MSSYPTPKGTLIAVVLRARHLPNRRRIEKQNPYCILRVGTVIDRTEAVDRGGQTPEWDHESRFATTQNQNPILKVSILDENNKSPELIGEADLNFVGAIESSVEEGYDKWHPLTYNGKDAGEIYIEMTFYPSQPFLPPKMKSESTKKKGYVPFTQAVRRPLPSLPNQPPLGPQTPIPPQPIAPAVSYSIPPPIAKAKTTQYISSVSSIQAPHLYENEGGYNIPNTQPYEMDSFQSVDLPTLPPLNHQQHNRGHNSVPYNTIPNLDLPKVPPSNEYISSTQIFRSDFEPAAGYRRTSSPTGGLNANLTHSVHPGTAPDQSYFRSSPPRRPPPNQNGKHVDAFDVLEMEMQSDWNRNHPQVAELRTSQPSQSQRYLHTGRASPMRKSLPPVGSKDLIYGHDRAQSNVNSHSYEGNDVGDLSQSISALNLINDYSKPENSLESQMPISSFPQDRNTRPYKLSSKPKLRKKPVPMSEKDNVYGNSSGPNGTGQRKSLPYSADTILEPTFDTPKKSTAAEQRISNEDEVYNASYYAPTPSTHFAKSVRLQHGGAKEEDFKLDPGVSGYIGGGQWSNNKPVYSSTEGDYNEWASRMNTASSTKPAIPPKVPLGISDREYYLLEKQQFLKDLNGRRE